MFDSRRVLSILFLMFRAALILWLCGTALLGAATDDALVSPVISAPIRSIPVNLPKNQSTNSSLQLNGADSELTVAVPSETASPSVFDDLNPQNNLSSQKAQILLKRNLLDDVTLTYQSNVGLASTTPEKSGTVTAQTAQNQSSTNLKWNVKDNWSVTSSNQMDQIFEFQRAEPSHVRNGIETHYQLNPGTGLGFGVNSEDYYSNNLATFERQTTAGQFQQKLGKLPLNWTASPALVKDVSPIDATQNRAGTRVDQSLLWNLNPDLSWNLGTGLTNWNYDIDTRKQVDRTIYSQWTRSIRKNFSLTLRTDLETIETASADAAPLREDKFKFSLGQQLLLTDDLSAAFDLKQEYQRDINSTWSPSDHSATLSIQKKF
ncbi:MAG: hypothetical protein B9S32_03990 [Verrucomicrobia bacterium Tous-C9LFEB]|nr:MAG: hypothetical protein B9S32_03990 [Verrucomicrobia bacterium Tous-C9LFEB]